MCDAVISKGEARPQKLIGLILQDAGAACSWG